MKKSNVTIIAAVIIALHLIVFALLIGIGRDRAEPASPEPAPPAAIRTEAATPAPSMSGFDVPNLITDRSPAKPAPAPGAEVKPRPAPAAAPAALPGNREGYLRNDLPDRRTAQNFPERIRTPYQGAVVVDAQSGRILFDDRSTSYGYPASVTKMMTLLVVLEQIDAGRVHLNDKVNITKEVAEIGGSEVYLDVRESEYYTVDDLLKALMIHSANDAARALALHAAGSRDAFVDMMNRKARELGMNATVYHSEHGLPPDDGSQPDISTAHDIALLSLAVLRHPETLRYTGAKLEWLPKSPIRDEKFMLANRNALVGKDPYPGCDGLKTGYHARGGYSLAATAERDGKRVVAVVLGVADRDSRNAAVKQLLDRGFEALPQ